MNQNLILQFLYDLEQNNCREWFHDHKQQYQAANGIFEELVETLMLELKKSDPTVLLTEPGKLTFKLVRDTRFSNDKDVYKRQASDRELARNNTQARQVRQKVTRIRNTLYPLFSSEM